MRVCLVAAVSLAPAIPVAFYSSSDKVEMGHVVASIFFYFLIAFIGLIVVIAAEDARPWYENLPAVAMGE